MHLDYLLIIQTLQQVHRLKNIIFTKTQKKLFLLHSKPVISENLEIASEMNEVNEMNEGKELNDPKDQIYDCYVKAKQKEGSNKFYKRLINNLDENIKRNF